MAVEDRCGGSDELLRDVPLTMGGMAGSLAVGENGSLPGVPARRGAVAIGGLGGLGGVGGGCGGDGILNGCVAGSEEAVFEVGGVRGEFVAVEAAPPEREGLDVGLHRRVSVPLDRENAQGIVRSMGACGIWWRPLDSLEEILVSPAPLVEVFEMSHGIESRRLDLDPVWPLCEEFLLGGAPGVRRRAGPGL